MDAKLLDTNNSFLINFVLFSASSTSASQHQVAHWLILLFPNSNRVVCTSMTGAPAALGRLPFGLRAQLGQPLEQLRREQLERRGRCHGSWRREV